MANREVSMDLTVGLNVDTVSFTTHPTVLNNLDLVVGIDNNPREEPSGINHDRFWLAQELGPIPAYPNPVSAIKYGGSRLNSTRRWADYDEAANRARFGGVLSNFNAGGMVVATFERVINPTTPEGSYDIKEFPPNSRAIIHVHLDRADITLMQADAPFAIYYQGFDETQSVDVYIPISTGEYFTEPFRFWLLPLERPAGYNFNRIAITSVQNIRSIQLNLQNASWSETIANPSGKVEFGIYTDSLELDFLAEYRLMKHINNEELKNTPQRLVVRDAETGDTILAETFFVKNIGVADNALSQYKIRLEGVMSAAENVHLAEIPLNASMRLVDYCNMIFRSPWVPIEPELTMQEINNTVIGWGEILPQKQWDAILMICEILRCNCSYRTTDDGIGRYELWRTL